MLAPLGGYGGNTETHALLPESLAIDHGTCTDIGNTLVPSDQRGTSRKADCDIGSYEYGGTITVLSSTANPVLVGDVITLTATIVEGEKIAPTGEVEFYDGSNILGSSEVDDEGRALLEINTMPAGSHPMNARYSGDYIFAGSTSVILIQHVAVTVVYLPIVFRLR